MNNIKKQNTEPTVSVCIITYNHESYIKQAIEGALMQKCNFPVEIVIGEDYSTDNTRRICEDFSRQYSQINFLPTESNLGVMPNLIRTLQACTGKYVAICEGDDYWTDPYKLQKQMDKLETNQQCVLCFHNSLIKYEDNSQPDELFCSGFTKNQIFSVKDVILKDWFIPTQSMFFRKSALLDYPEWLLNVYNGDMSLQLLTSLNGDIIYIDDTMSIYRKNVINSISTIKRTPYFFLNKKISLLLQFNRYSKSKLIHYIMLRIFIFQYRKLKIFISIKLNSIKITNLSFGTHV